MSDFAFTLCYHFFRNTNFPFLDCIVFPLMSNLILLSASISLETHIFLPLPQAAFTPFATGGAQDTATSYSVFIGPWSQFLRENECNTAMKGTCEERHNLGVAGFRGDKSQVTTSF